MRFPDAWKKLGRMGTRVAVALMLVTVMILWPVRATANAGTGAGAQVSVSISVRFGPPPLPVYAQPMCPGPGYIWTPGYWAWDPGYGYYWVPGTWISAPFPGSLWTPGYWGWNPAVALFVWHRGYWGLSVGFYGGIDYGFGYPGRGYYGGYWDHGRFFYNRAVSRVDIRYITHYYDRNDFHHGHWGRISYNGGRGGIDARPTRDDFRAERERRMGSAAEQDRQARLARSMPEERWSVNHGRPRIAATRRPERFMGDGVEHASRAGGAYHAKETRGQARPQGRDWHSFRQRPNEQGRSAQPGARDGGRQGYGGSPDARGQQMRQPQGQPSGWRQQRDQRTYRDQSHPRSQSSGNSGWQRMRQSPQQDTPAYDRAEKQRNSYSKRPSGDRQQKMRQQQQGSRARPAENGRGNSQQKAKPKGQQDKRGNPHGRHSW